MHLVAAAAQHQAAGLVVGRDHDEGLLRIAGEEREGEVHGLGHVVHLLEAGRGVVAVAGVVDLAAFDHEEEALLPVAGLQVADTGVGEVGQAGVILLAVDGVREGILRLGAQAQDARSGEVDLRDGAWALEDGDAGGIGLVLEVGRIVAGTPVREEGRSGHEVHGGIDHLEGNLLIAVAARGVRHEARRRGVVHAHAGGDARAETGRMGPFRQVRGGIAVRVHAHDAVVDLRTGRQRGAGGGGVGDQGVRGNRRDEVHHREAGEVHVFLAVRLVVEIRADDLVDAHAVPDEIEHILDLGLGGTAHHEQSEEEKVSYPFHIHLVNSFLNRSGSHP